VRADGGGLREVKLGVMELTTGSGGGAPAAGSKGRDETFRMRLSEGSDWIWMRFGGELLPMCLLRRRQWKVSRVRRRRGGDDGDAHVRRGGGGEGGGRYLEDETRRDGAYVPDHPGCVFLPCENRPEPGSSFPFQTMETSLMLHRVCESWVLAGKPTDLEPPKRALRQASVPTRPESKTAQNPVIHVLSLILGH
jgi:hypothetical protein